MVRAFVPAALPLRRKAILATTVVAIRNVVVWIPIVPTLTPLTSDHAMLLLRDQLKGTIASILAERMAYHDHSLTWMDHDFLVASLTDFTYDAIDKFLLGGKEHGEGTFVTDVDHGRELSAEIIDLFFYHKASQQTKH